MTTDTPPIAAPTPADEPVSMFGSLRIRNYRLFAGGQTISIVGTWMQNIAIGWLALQLSHSGTALGVVMAARFVPILFFGPWGGLLADRVDNRRLLTVTQVSLVTLSTALAVLSWRGLVTLPLLVALELMLGVTNVFDNPSRQNLIAQLVDRRHLGNAIALNSTTINMAKVAGPGVAGLIISTFGITPCFVCNAISYVAVVVSLLMIRSAEMYPLHRPSRAKGQIRDGLRYVMQTRELLYPMLMVVVTGILTWEFPVSLPLLTTDTFHAGARAYGLATAFMSLGSIAGGLITARRQQLTVASLGMSSLLWGLVICLAAVAPSLPIAYAALIFVGSSSVTFNASAKTLLQTNARPDMRGRVISLWAIAWQGGTVIGAPLVGLTASAFGPRYGLLLGGLAAGAAALFAVAARRAG
ncbi:MAG TPA: MFS transporter [Micromonosporaceae bacterium]|jgi:MFS family permease